jgi:hypothetical protein
MPEPTLWKSFLRNHWRIVLVLGAIAAATVAGAILVLVWFVGESQATDLVPRVLGLWSMDVLVTFFLHLIFWEVLLVGVPTGIAALVVYLGWWRRLPVEERMAYRRGHLFGKSSRRSDGGGAVTFLVTLGVVIKVYVDGNWTVPFATWSLEYLVFSYLIVFLWMLAIIGIPLTIGAIWWLRKEVSKEPPQPAP